MLESYDRKFVVAQTVKGEVRKLLRGSACGRIRCINAGCTGIARTGSAGCKVPMTSRMGKGARG